MSIADLLRFAIAASIISIPLYFTFRPKRTKQRPRVKDRPGEPYRVYTTEFDAIVHGRDIGGRLQNLSPDRDNCHWNFSNADRIAQIELAAQYRQGNEVLRGENSRAQGSFIDTSIMLLVDQSGSMRGMPIAWVVAGLHDLSEELSQSGAAIQIAGFTTAGWRGGFTRTKWLQDGRPGRPGRLCALLHVIYKRFDEESWDERCWEAMLDPNILRENIDGEALQWAANELRARNQPRKILMIISDGAPVDDSTLIENGDGILASHLRKVITDIEESGDIAICAIGVGYSVDYYYKCQIGIDVGEDFVSTALRLLDSALTWMPWVDNHQGTIA